jgi:NO-binding membrane sensor protein with MHYT domain
MTQDLVLQGRHATLVVLAAAIAAAAGGFRLMQYRRARRADAVAVVVVIGLGIAGMHYSGTAALRLPVRILYHAAFVAASVVIAVVATTTALFPASPDQTLVKRAFSAAVMGGAMSGIHFTSVAAIAIS